MSPILRTVVVVLSGMILCACSRQAYSDEIAETHRLLGPFRVEPSAIELDAAVDLHALLEELHESLFSRDGSIIQGPFQEKFPGILTRMKAWHDTSSQSHLIGMGRVAACITGPWYPHQVEQLAIQFPEETELWEFLEKSAQYLWNSAPESSDIKVCAAIWENSPLPHSESSEMVWKPSLRPLLNRMVDELYFVEKISFDVTESGIADVYQMSPQEFVKSFSASVRICKHFLDQINAGEEPEIAEVVGAFQGSCLERAFSTSLVAYESFSNG